MYILYYIYISYTLSLVYRDIDILNLEYYILFLIIKLKAPFIAGCVQRTISFYFFILLIKFTAQITDRGIYLILSLRQSKTKFDRRAREGMLWAVSVWVRRIVRFLGQKKKAGSRAGCPAAVLLCWLFVRLMLSRVYSLSERVLGRGAVFACLRLLSRCTGVLHGSEQAFCAFG